MIAAELFRQGPRPKAMAVAAVVNWIGTFIIALGFESVAVSTAKLNILNISMLSLNSFTIEQVLHLQM